MFENYLNTFGNHHSKYFSRLTIKVKIMLGVVNEDFHLKNSKSLQLKGLNINQETKMMANILPIQKYETIDTDTSSNCSSIQTPSASMDDEEENNVRFLIGNINENQDVQLELNTILQNIPQNENNSKRQTVKRNSNTIMEI